MITERLGTKDVGRAAGMLREGKLVAFPTETVYGLGGDALNAGAVGGVFAAKGRPEWDPVIVHVGERGMVEVVARVSDDAERLMGAFWPGPLTLLLPRTAAVPDVVTAGRELVGVRMPAHPLALNLIRLAGVPVAAPSANRFGGISPTTAAHVLADLDGRIDAVLDGGATRVGVESTVLDVGARVVYRAGAVTLAMISAALGEEVEFFRGGLEGGMVGRPSPGVGMRHYAPRARLVLVEGPEPVAAASGIGVGVMLPEGWKARAGAVVYPWGEWEDLDGLARRLFAGLRELDGLGVKEIVCPVPSGEGIGAALRDRLEKAARA